MFKFKSTLALVAAALALSATAASAQGLSRADVQSQLRAAQASGQMNLYGQDSGSAYLARQFHSSEPRAEVKSEIAQARSDGSLKALTSQDSGSAYLSRHMQLNEPRGEVKSELADARKEGNLNALYGQDSGSFALAANHGKLPDDQNRATAMR